MKNNEEFFLICIAILCIGLMIGILVGKVGTKPRISISEYDKTVANEPTPTAPYRYETAGKININVASADELTLLPGIGKTYADRIVAHRMKYGPFLSIEELTNIKGISESRFEAIKEYITVGG